MEDTSARPSLKACITKGRGPRSRRRGTKSSFRSTCNRFAGNFDSPTGQDRLSATRKLLSAKEAAWARGVEESGPKQLVFGFDGYRRRPGIS
jgi:hypothetical protein